MPMWMWRKVRRADISKADRDLFERFGETVIAMVLAGGLTPQEPQLATIHTNVETRSHARDWLTERGDLHERHEDRIELVEWAILLFVIISVIVELVKR